MKIEAFNIIAKPGYAGTPCRMDHLLEGAQLLCFLAQQNKHYGTRLCYHIMLHD